jgi:hypothetical protein
MGSRPYLTDFNGFRSWKIGKTPVFSRRAFHISYRSAAGPERLSGAGHTWRRHGTNDIEQATNSSSEEVAKTKKAKLETTSAQTTRSSGGKRTTAVEMAVQAAGVVTAAMAVRAVQGGTRRLAETGRRGFHEVAR